MSRAHTSSGIFNGGDVNLSYRFMPLSAPSMYTMYVHNIYTYMLYIKYICVCITYTCKIYIDTVNIQSNTSGVIDSRSRVSLHSTGLGIANDLHLHGGGGRPAVDLADKSD